MKAWPLHGRLDRPLEVLPGAGHAHVESRWLRPALHFVKACRSRSAAMILHADNTSAPFLEADWSECLKVAKCKCLSWPKFAAVDLLGGSGTSVQKLLSSLAR